MKKAEMSIDFGLKQEFLFASIGHSCILLGNHIENAEKPLKECTINKFIVMHGENWSSSPTSEKTITLKLY